MKHVKIFFTVGFLFIAVLAVAQDSTARKELLGKYKFPAGSVVEEVIVLVDNNSLMMNSTAGTSPLELVKGDTFNIVNFNGIAVFKRNETKKIIGVHIDASGYVLDGVKDSVAITATHLELHGTGQQFPGADYCFAPGAAVEHNVYRRRSANELVE